MEWRKQWDTDNLPDWDPPQVLKDFLPYGLSGFDKDGAPGKIYYDLKIKITNFFKFTSSFKLS